MEAEQADRFDVLEGPVVPHEARGRSKLLLTYCNETPRQQLDSNVRSGALKRAVNGPEPAGAAILSCVDDFELLLGRYAARNPSQLVQDRNG